MPNPIQMSICELELVISNNKGHICTHIHTYSAAKQKDALFSSTKLCFKTDLLLKSAVSKLTTTKGKPSKPDQALAWPPFSRTRQKCQSQKVTFVSKIQHNSCSCRVQMRHQSQRHILKLSARTATVWKHRGTKTDILNIFMKWYWVFHDSTQWLISQYYYQRLFINCLC